LEVADLDADGGNAEEAECAEWQGYKKAITS
jgi:hypothetical protein